MDDEQVEISTHEASQRSGMSQRHLASLLRQHKLEGSYDSKRRRWMVNAAALERFLTLDGKAARLRRYTYATCLYERAQQAVQEGHPAQAEPLYQKAITLFDQIYGTGSTSSIRIRNDLGHLYIEQQRYKEAEILFIQALSDEAWFYDTHLLFTVLTSISDLYLAQDRILEAQPYIRQKQNIIANHIKRVNEQIERARMLMDQQNYYEAARILLTEANFLTNAEMLDDSTKSALLMTHLSLFILQDMQEDVHLFLKQLQSLLSEARVEMDDAEFLYRLGENFRQQRRYWEAKVFFCYALKLLEQYDKNTLIQLKVWLALKSLGQLYHEQEKYPEAETAYLRALSVIESLRGTEHPDVAFILRNLVHLAVDQGNYRDALPLLERAQSIEKQSSPESEDRSPGTILYHDANRLLEQGQVAEAEALLRRALTLDEQEQGPVHPDVVDDLTLLAHVLLKQEKLAEAEQFARRALAIGEQQEGNQTATILVQLHLLSLIAHAQGEEKEAVSFQQRLTACNLPGSRSDDIGAIFAFHTAALHAVTQGHYTEAEALLQHTLIVYEHVLGKEHRHVVLCLNQLAEIYGLQGKYQQAEALLIRILALSKQSESELPLLVVTSLYLLAQTCLAQKDLTRAECLAERAYQEAEQTVGLDHMVTGIALMAKGRVLFLQEKTEEADVLAKRAESILTGSQTARSLFQLCAGLALVQLYNDIAQRKKLSALYRSMPQYVDAEPLARHALHEAERQLAADHPLLPFFLCSLAFALAFHKQYPEAGALYQRALTITESVSEPAHELMFTLLQGLGEVYEEQNQYALAERTYKQALEICEQHGDQSPSQMYRVIHQIGLMCMLQGKTEEGQPYIERSFSMLRFPR